MDLWITRFIEIFSNFSNIQRLNIQINQRVQLKQNKSMRNQSSSIKPTFVLLLFSFMLIKTNSIRTNETFEQAQADGIWTSVLDAGNFNNLPAQYFMCGFSLLTELFQSVRPCQCKLRWYNWRYQKRCRVCVLPFNSRSAGIKIFFCHYLKWEDKIQKIFQTGSPQKGAWRSPIMCPEDTYVNGFSAAFGQQSSDNLGFHGLRIKCSIKTTKYSSFHEDRANLKVEPMHNAKVGNFISAVRIKYRYRGMLSGFAALYEPMIKISKVQITYKNDSILENYPMAVDLQKVKNCGQNQAVKRVGFTKTYEGSGRWTINNPQISRYEVDRGIIITPPNLSNRNEKISSAIYQVITQNFGFDRQIKTTISSIQDIVVSVSKNSEAIVSTIVNQQRGSLPFSGKIYLKNAFNDQDILTHNINGIWEGVTNTGVQNIIQQKPSCFPDNQNLRA